MKRLAGETAIYGVSSIVGKFLNWMLAVSYTHLDVYKRQGCPDYKNAYLSLLKTTGLTIYPYEKNILAYLVARQSLLFVCRRPDRIGNDGPGRNTFRSKSG